MSGNLEETCCCKICKSVNFKQDALNQCRRKKRDQFRPKLGESPEGRTRAERERDTRETTHEGLGLFENEAFVVGQDLHPVTGLSFVEIFTAFHQKDSFS